MIIDAIICSNNSMCYDILVQCAPHKSCKHDYNYNDNIKSMIMMISICAIVFLYDQHIDGLSFGYHISNWTVAVTVAMSGVPIVLSSSRWPSSGGKLQLLVTFIAASAPILHEASKSIRTQDLASILAMFLAEIVIMPGVTRLAINASTGHYSTHHNQNCLWCVQIYTKPKCPKAARPRETWPWCRHG